jgi:hypothetical protein
MPKSFVGSMLEHARKSNTEALISCKNDLEVRPGTIGPKRIQEIIHTIRVCEPLDDVAATRHIVAGTLLQMLIKRQESLSVTDTLYLDGVIRS